MFKKIFSFIAVLCLLCACSNNKSNYSEPPDQELILFANVTGVSEEFPLRLKNNKDEKVVVADGFQELFVVQKNSSFEITQADGLSDRLCQISNGKGQATSGDIKNIRITCEDINSPPFVSKVPPLIKFAVNNFTNFQFFITEAEGQQITVAFELPEELQEQVTIEHTIFAEQAISSEPKPRDFRINGTITSTVDKDIPVFLVVSDGVETSKTKIIFEANYLPEIVITPPEQQTYPPGTTLELNFSLVGEHTSEVFAETVGSSAEISGQKVTWTLEANRFPSEMKSLTLFTHQSIETINVEVVDKALLRNLDIYSNFNTLNSATLVSDKQNELHLYLLHNSGLISKNLITDNNVEPLLSNPFRKDGGSSTHGFITLSNKTTNDIKLLTVGFRQLSLIDKETLATVKTWPIAHSISKVKSGFLSNDAQEKIIFKNSHSEDPNRSSIYIWDISQKVEDAIEIPLTYDTEDYLIANVDDDESAEIISAAGEVIDIETRTSQWLNEGKFGDIIFLTDANNDGITDLIGIDRFTKLRVYDTRRRKLLASSELFGCYNWSAEDLTGDKNKELVAICDEKVTSFKFNTDLQLEINWQSDKITSLINLNLENNWLSFRKDPDSPAHTYFLTTNYISADNQVTKVTFGEDPAPQIIASTKHIPFIELFLSGSFKNKDGNESLYFYNHSNSPLNDSDRIYTINSSYELNSQEASFVIENHNIGSVSLVNSDKDNNPDWIVSSNGNCHIFNGNSVNPIKTLSSMCLHGVFLESDPLRLLTQSDRGIYVYDFGQQMVQTHIENIDNNWKFLLLNDENNQTQFAAFNENKNILEVITLENGQFLQRTPLEFQYGHAAGVFDYNNDGHKDLVTSDNAIFDTQGNILAFIDLPNNSAIISGFERPAKQTEHEFLFNFEGKHGEQVAAMHQNNRKLDWMSMPLSSRALPNGFIKGPANKTGHSGMIIQTDDFIVIQKPIEN